MLDYTEFEDAAGNNEVHIQFLLPIHLGGFVLFASEMRTAAAFISAISIFFEAAATAGYALWTIAETLPHTILWTILRFKCLTSCSIVCCNA